MPRQIITVRLSDSGVEELDQIADAAKVKRADVLRMAFKVALTHRKELLSEIEQLKEQP